MTQPLRVGIIGMGGHAGVHHNVILKLESAGECRLVCTCDPRLADFAARQAELEFPRRQVRLFEDYRAMLATCGKDLDVLVISTPVPLHAEMHRAGVEHGIAVYLEKPPALDPDEMDQMLAAEQSATKLTNVGFNYIVEAQRQALKRRLIDDEFGAVRQVGFRGLSPRGADYYARAGWAGRLMLNNQIVLDSCLGNAMAHFAHNALFWCGRDSVLAWGSLSGVEAELYRANNIEGVDTVFAKAFTRENVEVRLALSHACDKAGANLEWVECEKARINYVVDGSHCPGPCQHFAIRWNDGHEETGHRQGDVYLSENLRAYFDYVRGRTDRPLTRLIDSLPFVQLNALAYLAAGRIVTVPEDAIIRSTGPKGDSQFAVIRDLERIVARFTDAGEFPAAQGVAWAQRGGRAGLKDLPRLRAVVGAMAAARARELKS